MDINEVVGEIINRHPWELSRTGSVIKEVLPYLKKCEKTRDYINIGAGDMFFDKALLKKLKDYKIYAVDLGYASVNPEIFDVDKKSFTTFTSIDELPEDLVTDSAFMMDSLEYIEDDITFLKELAGHIRNGGYIFITVPAFRALFSKHDSIVRNLRRYDKSDLMGIIESIQGLHLVRIHYFYTSLFLIRYIQKIFNMEIDPQHKVTTGWKYGERQWITCFVKGILNIDYAINKIFGKFHFDIPGLSIMVIIRKDGI